MGRAAPAVHRRAAVLAVALAVAAAPALAEPGPRERFAELLRQHFSQAERVAYVELRPDTETQVRLYRALGENLRESRYSFWVATGRDGRVLGFAHLGRERSQHGHFLFAVFFDVDRRITDVEVVQYREHDGGAIRSRAFLSQFAGHGAATRLGVGHNIDAVTGATISSTALTRGVQRAVLLLQAVRAP